jgi:hypothetical protein
VVDVFERRVVGRMYGPFKERDQCRCSFNKELYDLLKEPRLLVVIRNARLGWAGHVARMEEICMLWKLMYVQLEGLSKLGRPRTRWRHEVGKNARMLGMRSWWAAAMTREEWRKLVKGIKTAYVLQCR